MTLRQRYDSIIGYFRNNVPVAESELHFDSPFQLLVAVMLSAQCTDRRVNMVTPALFRGLPRPCRARRRLSGGGVRLHPFGHLPQQQGRPPGGHGEKLVSDFGGEVPSDIDRLMTLPGVGRKTANVVASITWGEPVIAVDTHVFRVARRLGLSDGKNVREVELDLEANIPEELRPIAHHWLILHGRYTCTALKPKCDSCPLAQWCRDKGR